MKTSTNKCTASLVQYIQNSAYLLVIAVGAQLAPVACTKAPNSSPSPIVTNSSDLSEGGHVIVRGKFLGNAKLGAMVAMDDKVIAYGIGLRLPDDRKNLIVEIAGKAHWHPAVNTPESPDSAIRAGFGSGYHPQYWTINDANLLK